jgi:hypothetical protein
MSGNAFKVAVEIDGATIDELNRKFKQLAAPMGTKAMKSGFREWFKKTRAVAKAMAPYGRPAATEKVRGVNRPNPHIKDHMAYTVRGYSKGRVVWGGLGIRNRGGYDTPHWYLRWVEFGHDLKRKATPNEAMLLKSRGERKMTMSIGRVEGAFFLRKAYQMTAMRLIPIMEEAIAKQVAKHMEGKRG